MNKYRVWKKDEGKYLSDEFHDRLMLSTDGSMWLLSNTENWGVVAKEDITEKVDIEFCIGLRDTSDEKREMYVGDRVRVWGEGADDDDFTEHKIVFFGDRDYPAYDLDPPIDTDCNGISYALAVGRIEVFGHIHSKVLKDENID